MAVTVSCQRAREQGDRESFHCQLNKKIDLFLFYTPSFYVYDHICAVREGARGGRKILWNLSERWLEASM